MSLNLPYFYDEDEAHHFNRTVNMVKNRDLNPNYFHKPSLHFYMRMPVVMLSYLWNKRQGHIGNIKEIRTHNKFGIAEYAFTTSHPGIVKWNRAFSVVLSLLIVVFTYLIALALSDSLLIAGGAALISAVSPPLIAYSATVGVDVPMTLMCLISVYFAIKLSKSGSQKYLYASAIFAGLAVSSKYNAAPIAAVPLLACYVCGKFSRKNFIIAFLVPILVFIAASPYLLVSADLFIRQVSYEIWHYSIAGHEGNSASPGSEQIIFYSKWYWNEAIGPVVSLCGLLGMIFLILKPSRQSLVFLCFPLLFFALMIAQKVNFTRNMLVTIPFLAVCSAYFMVTIVRNVMLSKRISCIAVCLLLLISALPPLSWALSERSEALMTSDSRDQLLSWFDAHNDVSKETALSGQLQVPKEIYRASNVTVVNEDKTSLIELYLAGFDRIIGGAAFGSENHNFFKVIQKFGGVKEKQRIVKDPLIIVADFMRTPQLLERLHNAAESCSDCNLNMLRAEDGTYVCSSASSAENYCWTTKRLSKITLPDLESALGDREQLELEIEAMSPWENNAFHLNPDSEWTKSESGSNGQWKKYRQILLKTDTSGNTIKFYALITSSPFRRLNSDDKRRLGWAIKNIKIVK